MDVIIETKEGHNWELEIGFFDTVLEIKEKIQKYHGIPVSRQTLFFNGSPLADDHDIEHYIIHQGSRLQLYVDPGAGKPKAEDVSMQVARISVNVDMTKRQFTLEANVAETIGLLKERVQEAEGLPAGRFGLFLRGVEMQDNLTVAHYGLGCENVEVNVVINPCPLSPSSATAGAATSAARKVRVILTLSKSGMQMPVEVNMADNVSELRNELQRLQGQLHFNLPGGEGYFFVYKQNVMDEERTFRWHQVRHNDTIDIFGGGVTGGS